MADAHGEKDHEESHHSEDSDGFNENIELQNRLNSTIGDPEHHQIHNNLNPLDRWDEEQEYAALPKKLEHNRVPAYSMDDMNKNNNVDNTNNEYAYTVKTYFVMVH